MRAWDVDGMRGEWGAAEEVAAMRHGDQSVAVMGREEAMRIELVREWGGGGGRQ